MLVRDAIRALLPGFGVGRTDAAERYAEMFDLIVLAESLGFDVAWLAELHFGGAFSLLANPSWSCR